MHSPRFLLNTMATKVFSVLLSVCILSVFFSNPSAAEEALTTLSGELGMVVGMKFDGDNRVMGGHYTEYTVTNQDDIVPIEATPNIR